MQTLSPDQMIILKSLSIEALKGMNFQSIWIDELKRCLNEDTDCSCHAFELANYISWNMRSSGIHSDNIALADSCAFQAVLFAANEILGFSKII